MRDNPRLDVKRSKRRRLALFAGVNAVAAWAGAGGVMTGRLELGREIDARLPFASPVVAGLALAVVVALPLSVVAGLAWRGDAATPEAAAVAGFLLVGWIGIQLLFIQEFSFFHPAYVTVGAVLVLWALHDARCKKSTVRASHGG
jgi:hypothetical protein